MWLGRSRSDCGVLVSREHGGPEGMDPGSGIKSNWNEIVDNFDDMNLKESLLRGIYAYGFEKPSAIQQRAIIPCIKGKIPLPFRINVLQIHGP